MGGPQPTVLFCYICETYYASGTVRHETCGGEGLAGWPAHWGLRPERIGVPVACLEGWKRLYMSKPREVPFKRPFESLPRWWW